MEFRNVCLHEVFLRGLEAPNTGSYSDQECYRYANEVQEAMDALDKGPNGSINPNSIETFLMAVNNLNKYLTANPPTDSFGKALVTDLGKLIPLFGKSLGDLAEKYNDPTTITEFQQNWTAAVKPALNGFYNDVWNASGVANNSVNEDLKYDVEILQHLLQQFSSDSIAGKDTTNEVIMIAYEIKRLSDDGKGSTDGWIKVLMDSINSVASTSGTPSPILGLAEAIATNPGNKTDVMNLSDALKAMGEANNGGGSLSQFLSETLSKEGWPT